MKTAILILLVAISLQAKAQDVPKGWQRIYYVLEGKTEVARRFCSDSTWIIDDPAKALEAMYREKLAAEKRYELALAILKLLNPNGTPTDQRRYNEAVKSYNDFLSKPH